MSTYWSVEPGLDPLMRIEHLAHNVSYGARYVATSMTRHKKDTAKATLTFLCERPPQPNNSEHELLAEALYVIDLSCSLWLGGFEFSEEALETAFDLSEQTKDLYQVEWIEDEDDLGRFYCRHGLRAAIVRFAPALRKVGREPLPLLDMCDAIDAAIGAEDYWEASELADQICTQVRTAAELVEEPGVSEVEGECGAPQDAGLTPTPRCSIALNGPTEPVVVFGNEKPPLSEAEYRAVKAIVDAFPKGLTKDEIEDKAGSARRDLTALRTQDADYKRAIIFPGKAGRGGYRAAAAE